MQDKLDPSQRKQAREMACSGLTMHQVAEYIGGVADGNLAGTASR
ncbi:MAG: hypothetical protein ACXWP0_17845 [Ktedonobacterales bacterium]